MKMRRVVRREADATDMNSATKSTAPLPLRVEGVANLATIWSHRVELFAILENAEGIAFARLAVASTTLAATTFAAFAAFVVLATTFAASVVVHHVVVRRCLSTR